MKEPKPDSPEWREWARLAFDQRINEVQQLREQLAAEQEKAAAWVVELADRYEKKLDAERQKVQTLTDELNRIREVATKTDWNLALRIATVLEKVEKYQKVSKIKPYNANLGHNRHRCYLA